jgi:hypothetical protein
VLDRLDSSRYILRLLLWAPSVLIEYPTLPWLTLSQV